MRGLYQKWFESNCIYPRVQSVRRWCSGIMQDSHSCDLGSILGQCMFCLFFFSAGNFRCKSILKHHFKRGCLGLNQGPLNLQSNALPLSYTPIWLFHIQNMKSKTFCLKNEINPKKSTWKKATVDQQRILFEKKFSKKLLPKSSWIGGTQV